LKTGTQEPRRGAPAASPWDLLAASFLFLFFEFIILRWIPAYVRIVAYFSNLILISCFAGFGLGCILKKKGKGIFSYFPYLLFTELLLTRFLSEVGVKNPFEAQEVFFGLSMGLSWYAVIPLIFSLNALLFACLGQKVAQELDRFPPLKGYALNIVGSLVGIGAFSILSFLQIRPTWHFAACFLCVLWLLRASSRPALALAAAALLAGGGIAHQREVRSIWSPYNKINLFAYEQAPDSGSFSLTANNDLHQVALNLSAGAARASDHLRGWQTIYDFPYRALGRAPARVLVLGAGTGNDVAAALRNGAGRVDAVELDPVIADLGARLHPENPYGDRRVTVHVDDARSFLRRPREPYDLIVMGWLDSHRLFSSLSNIRQDNFVYTAESLKEIRAQLGPDGLLCLSFFVGKPWIADKIAQMIGGAFGREARRPGKIFLAAPRPGLLPAVPPSGFVDATEELPKTPEAAMPMDDWPFLYYKDRTLTPDYFWTLGLLLAATAAMVLLAVPWRELRGAHGLIYFFLGAGFMLLETRNMTVLALLYGSTWIVTSAVVSSILAMSLLGTVMVQNGWLRNEKVVWSLLFLTLVGNFFLRSQPFADSPRAGTLLMTLAASASFLFAGVVFARAFERAESPSQALGWNVLGAVLGGLCEYLGLVLGLRALLFIAAAFYAAAWFCRRAGVRVST
jgi:SAM-dependent methyltransferase